MSTRGTRPTRTQCDLLRKNGKFPDDYLFIGTYTKQDAYKGTKNKQNLDREGTKTQIMKFRNRSEGFVIELEVV